MGAWNELWSDNAELFPVWCPSVLDLRLRLSESSGS